MWEEKQERKERENTALGCVVDQTPEVLEGVLNYEDRIGINELLDDISLGSYSPIPGFLGLYVQLE